MGIDNVGRSDWLIEGGSDECWVDLCRKIKVGGGWKQRAVRIWDLSFMIMHPT